MVLLLVAVLVLLALPAQAQTTPSCFGREATIVGTSASELLIGTSGRDVIAALGGHDTVGGQEGNDFICGGPGTDDVDGSFGADQISGAAGHDELQGGGGPDRLLNGTNMFGDAGDDYLRAPPNQPYWLAVELEADVGFDTCIGDANDRYKSCEVIRIIG